MHGSKSSAGLMCLRGYRFTPIIGRTDARWEMDGERARGYGNPHFRDFLLAAPARVREAAASRVQRAWVKRSNDPGTLVGRRVVLSRFHEMEPI